MRGRLATCVGAVGVALACARGADARVDVHIGIVAPPPPVVVFHHAPEVILVPHTEVYYAPVPDYDVYRYGPYWYVNRDGYWYRGRSYRGPFVPIVYERVPRAILVVPGEYHRHPFRPHVHRVRDDHGRGRGHWRHGGRAGHGGRGDHGRGGRGRHGGHGRH